MDLFSKTLMAFSLFSLAFLSLEAKAIEILLDRKVEKKFHLFEGIPEQRQEQPLSEASSPWHLPGPSLALYCKKLTIKNVGDKPIENCFPYVNRKPALSLESLDNQIAKEASPLLALYKIWNRAIVIDELSDASNCHPLDLMNFKGGAKRLDSFRQFLRLCNALGIETRLANIQGRELYDFGINDEWQFLDFNGGIFYQSLDNEKLASSEEVMDDPFLALRTKHSRAAQQIDFRECWKQVAAFDLLHPSSSLPLNPSVESLTSRGDGFTLFPGDALQFENSQNLSELKGHECSICHLVNLESRSISHRLVYHSPIPIRRLRNDTLGNVQLVEQKLFLAPGESIDFDCPLFKIKLSFDSKPKGKLAISGICAWTLFPSLAAGENLLHLGVEKNPTKLKFKYVVDEHLEGKISPPVCIANQDNIFDFCSPYFLLDCEKRPDFIWWQISSDSQFQSIPPNFDQVEPFVSTVTLTPISETFLSPGNTYYFRVKGNSCGVWGEWSSAFAFTVQKPSAVEAIEFEEIDDNIYELNWERYAEPGDEAIEYFIFGSNSLDFIPSIYTDFQVNSIVNGIVEEEEVNENLIGRTSKPKFRVKGVFAYYRVIAMQRGALSVPSSIVRVYDQELIQPRNALQIVKEDSRDVAKRVIFPAAYPWTETSLPRLLGPSKRTRGIIQVQSFLRSMSTLTTAKYRYEFPEVSEEVWKKVRPYLLPENHPAWAKLNRLFCRIRATQTPDHFKKAGFRRWRPGRFSRVAASSHPEFQEYFIKAYCDSELGIIYDWKKWIHRIRGAETIRACIRDYELQDNFKVPRKWIYPLPKHPSPPHNSHYVRKDFILICENVQILDHSKNESAYKHKMTPKLIKGLYTILQVCGLYDSVYVFNIPFCKDGRIAIIDTEYHHKWPVPFQKLNNKFSSTLQNYWKKITYSGGSIPNGVNEPNPPRMDRRDVQR